MYRDSGTTYTTMRELGHIVPAKSVTACDLLTFSVMSFCFRSVTACASTASSELYDLKCQFSERSKAKGAVLKFQKSERVSGETQSGTMCMYVCIQILYVSLYGRTSLRVCMFACFIVSVINQTALVCAGLQTYSAALRQCCSLMLAAHR